MANTSIYNAFERMWQHTVALVGSSGGGGGIPVVAATSTDGETYTATIDNFDIATNKAIILIPNMNSYSNPGAPAPVLKINGDTTGTEIRYTTMGEYGEYSEIMPTPILRANSPILLGHDGTYWRPTDQLINANYIVSGVLSAEHGGTGNGFLGNYYAPATPTNLGYRASRLVDTEIEPTINGVINWMYE